MTTFILSIIKCWALKRINPFIILSGYYALRVSLIMYTK